MRFCPAPVNTGIVFKRTDLPNQPIIPATLSSVWDTSRSTNLGIGELKIYTIEHVLAALYALQVDNLMIELSNIEPPVGNGSSDLFVQMIEEAGIEEQTEARSTLKIETPIYWSQDPIHLVALPSEGYHISYTLSYPSSPVLKAQYHSTIVDSTTFKREIAPCRTFSLYEEVAALMDRDLIKGASLNNGVVIFQNEMILSKEGLFFPDEMVRHKVLDMIGDLSLIGMDLQAHIIAIRTGHASNYAFAKKIVNGIYQEAVN